jgi:hypothetical protein
MPFTWVGTTADMMNTAIDIDQSLNELLWQRDSPAS